MDKFITFFWIILICIFWYNLIMKINNDYWDRRICELNIDYIRTQIQDEILLDRWCEWIMIKKEDWSIITLSVKSLNSFIY